MPRKKSCFYTPGRTIWLRWVVLADQAHPPGTLEVLLPSLLRGYVDRFAPNDIAHDLPLDPWVQVCAAAWRAAATYGGSASVDYPREPRDHRVEQPTS